ncbi:dCMP deaminase family protein [Candidatus Woesearchaeota archaeon]|nr:hypothetical protein [uncultured archaeon]AQS32083.1 hypothetical protein [uncultured archaeon]MBS3115277.1 dCMP deaminase family protein [Candidatus Woesearchaeota archaeon]
MPKRTDYISKEDFNMAAAFLIAKRSKDPSSQVGSVIVDENDIIVAMGYNGFPRGCDDDIFPWDKEGEFLNTKYAYVVHAEKNAIHNRNTASLKGCRMYNNLSSCNECTKDIIQVGIKEVIYFDDKYNNRDSHKAARRMFEAANVIQRQYKGNLAGIELLFKKQ